MGECPKCGGHDIVTRYEKGCGGFRGCTSHPERLTHGCRSCGFHWDTPTLDACQHKYPDPNGQGFPVDQCLNCGEWRRDPMREHEADDRG